MAQEMKTEEIMRERYDAGFCYPDGKVVIWAAERAMKEIGKEKARKEVKKINKIREKYGCIPAYIPYGSPLFD